MSSRDIRDDWKSDRIPVGGVHCELLGGGSQDGLRLHIRYRFDYVCHTVNVKVRLHEGDEPVGRFHDSLYEYSGLYRLCPERGRVYLYQYSGAEVYGRDDVVPMYKSGDSAAPSELDEVSSDDITGTHGGNECWDGCEG